MLIKLRAVCMIGIATRELNHLDNAASVKWFGVDKQKMAFFLLTLDLIKTQTFSQNHLFYCISQNKKLK